VTSSPARPDGRSSVAAGHRGAPARKPWGVGRYYGIVHYGTDPKDLSQTAKNPIRLNQGHQYTTFRVRIEGLKPQTTYYYTVTSEESNGTSDGVKSTVSKFTTPAPGERIVGARP